MAKKSLNPVVKLRWGDEVSGEAAVLGWFVQPFSWSLTEIWAAIFVFPVE